ncbi:MAG: hypothetical protein KIT73_11825 [Burkholderiales bacterium]|nr:hypothetical protein [Burkholderiales bacterium]
MLEPTEKEQIERAAVTAFLELYNREFGRDFSVTKYSDSPDCLCEDSAGEQMSIEVTTTEDQPGDTMATLGRSQHRSLDALREHLADIRAGRALPRINSLNLAAGTLANRIEQKWLKRYGKNTLLLVQDTSGVDWNWELAISDLQKLFAPKLTPFDLGVWLLPRARQRLFRVL